MPRNAAGSQKQARTNALTSLTRTILWAKASGRCQYAGCNKLSIGDLISGAEDKNFGFVAISWLTRRMAPAVIRSARRFYQTTSII